MLQALSANVDGPRDAASCKIDHSTLCNHQAMSVGRNHIATQTDRCWLLAHNNVNDNAQTPLGRFVS